MQVFRIVIVMIDCEARREDIGLSQGDEQLYRIQNDEHFSLLAMTRIYDLLQFNRFVYCLLVV